MTRLFFTMNVKTAGLFLYSIVLIYFGLVQGMTNERPPVLKYQPLQDMIKYINSTFIPCEAEGEFNRNGSTSHEYSWKKDGRDINASVTCEPKNTPDCIYGLSISEANKNDRGTSTYQCFVKNELGTAMSNPVTLLRVQPAKVPSASEKNAHVGVPFSFSYPESMGNSLKSNNNYWKYCPYANASDDKCKTLYDNDRGMYDPERKFHIFKIENEDEGYYKYYFNSSGNGESDILIYEIGFQIDTNEHETVAPTYQYVSKENELAIGNETKRLFCMYSGNRTITWKYKNGTILDSKTNPEKYVIPESQNYVDIKNFTMDDQETYTCEMKDNKNMSPPKQHNIAVKIGKPFFEKTPVNVDDLEGSNVTLYCQTYNEFTSIQWFYNTKPIEISNNSAVSSAANNIPTLTINNIQEEYRGNYGCNVSNTHGHVYKEAYVYVQKIEFRIFDESQVNITIEKSEGETLYWTCPVEGFPTPQIKWMKNNEAISNDTGDDRISFTNGSKLLTINNVNSNDQGDYFCYVTQEKVEGFSYLGVKAIIKPNSSVLTIIFYVIGFLVIAAIIAAVLIVCKQRGYARSIYDLRKREREAAANQRNQKVEERNDVSLLAGNSPRTATLNLRRQSTKNGVSLAEVQLQSPA